MPEPKKAKSIVTVKARAQGNSCKQSLLLIHHAEMKGGKNPKPQNHPPKTIITTKYFTHISFPFPQLCTEVFLENKTLNYNTHDFSISDFKFLSLLFGSQEQNQLTNQINGKGIWPATMQRIG